jgi:hypothetical protein
MDVGDLEQIKFIHEKFFKEEFDFPDFKKFIGAYVVINNDEIVTAGGVRPIAESVIITNESTPVKLRREGLLEMLAAQRFICSQYGLDQLHAFIADSKWKRHLINSGFEKCKGDAIYLNI